MTGPAQSRFRAADLVSNGGQEPLPARPLLTTPPHLQRHAFADLQREHLAAQPWLGVGGLLLGAVVFFALALGLGSTEASLLVLGPLATFALPAVAMIAFWWNDWPGSQLTTPWTGLTDTVLVAGAAVVLTIAGQAVVERPDVRGVFEGGLGRLRSGIAALALAWGIGIGAYFLFVNVDAVPAAARAAAGLRNPGGPVPGPDLGSALIAVGVWQAVFFIVLRGWPVNTMSQQGRRRLIAGNILVIGLGAATYLVLRDGAGLQPGTISAACGCVISAAIIVGMLFEGWPAARLSPGPGRALAVALTAAVAVALNRALAAYADGVAWGKATPDDWVTTAALSFIGAGIILHVGIGLRWPFAVKSKKNEGADASVLGCPGTGGRRG